MAGVGDNIKPLQLGSVQFQDFEVPPELTDLGLVQAMAVHDFGGGIRAIQLFGTRIPEKKWRGLLFGADAESRANQLSDMADRGDPVTLSYSGWSFYGVVEHFQIIAQSAWEIQYECNFVPVDNNSSGSSSSVPATATAQSLLNAAQSVANNQATNPASQATIPANVQTNVQNLTSGITTALQNNFNNIANIPASLIQSLQGQVSSTRQSLASMIASTDPAIASAARDLDQTLQVINHLLTNPAPAQREIDITNPNLFMLASAFYGDPSKWDLIKDANGLLDPLPQGTFHLTIPTDASPFQPTIPVLFQ